MKSISERSTYSSRAPSPAGYRNSALRPSTDRVCSGTEIQIQTQTDLEKQPEPGTGTGTRPVQLKYTKPHDEGTPQPLRPFLPPCPQSADTSHNAASQTPPAVTPHGPVQSSPRPACALIDLETSQHALYAMFGKPLKSISPTKQLPRFCSRKDRATSRSEGRGWLNSWVAYWFCTLRSTSGSLESVPSMCVLKACCSQKEDNCVGMRAMIAVYVEKKNMDDEYYGNLSGASS
ncbi:hypothetical protein K504DRAFT_79306 [Pleomassaria siparia CBS 279.74]|uniref:Uncharacterized protein n=1 Tax=Pleomassaria siparia CBS 279.74 TaxID=1314801 RepID=A0A6G1K0G4_9PLEO|nr:hypothetical protein K504DRAFT_79306 [Pleomassaria siparia CBS 279.74]